MPENNDSATIQIADGVTGRQRIRVLLMAKGYSTIASWARARGIEHDQTVHMMLSGTRPYPEIRDMLAADLGITRDELDAIISAAEAA